MMLHEFLAHELQQDADVLGRPEVRHGVTRLRVRAAAIPRVMELVLGRLGLTLLLVAGEDRRRHSGDLRVHYLAGRAASHELVHIEVVLDPDRPAVPTLAAQSFPASRFEREMRDMFGITPTGHPDSRPLARHGFWPEHFHPLLQDAIVPAFEDDGRLFPFTPVEGDGVYEIPVGPIHASVIEPGHFRFNVLGETILKMRARLYFTHKGTEKLFEGRLPDDGVPLAERISGDTSVAHALAYCQALESLSDADVPARAVSWRTALVELERLYNHVTDTGALLADTGFAIGQAHAMRLREGLLRLNKRVTGHRLLRGVVVPGGVTSATYDLPRLLAELARTVADFDELVDISLANTLVSDRLEETGRLSRDVATDFGVVGYVARACGIEDDARVDFPCAAYGHLHVTPNVEHTSDVKARLLVRVREARQAVGLIEEALTTPAPTADLRSDIGSLAAYTVGFGIVEAWRGRLTHAVVVDEHGLLQRVKVVDPSFFNWPALARALEDNIVPDFPLCNKSFNQSYSGNDL